MARLKTTTRSGRTGHGRFVRRGAAPLDHPFGSGRPRLLCLIRGRGPCLAARSRRGSAARRRIHAENVAKMLRWTGTVSCPINNNKSKTARKCLLVSHTSLGKILDLRLTRWRVTTISADPLHQCALQLTAFFFLLILGFALQIAFQSCDDSRIA